MRPTSHFLLILILFFCFEGTALFSQSYDWAYSPDGTKVQYAVDLAVDQVGNSYVVGAFNDTLIIGLDTLVTASHSRNYFLAKFDPLGNPNWAQSAYGTGGEIGIAVEVGADGTIYIAGILENGRMVIVPGDTMESFGGKSLWIAAFDPIGSPLWAIHSNPMFGWPDVQGMVVREKMLYLCGSYPGDSLDFGAYPLFNAGGSLNTEDAFIMCIDSMGHVSWSQGFGTDRNETMTGLDFKDDDTLVFCGNYGYDTLAFHGLVLQNQSLKSDFFIGKISTLGKVEAVQSGGCTDTTLVNDLVVNGDKIYVVGEFQDSLLNPTDTLISWGGGDPFLIQYDFNLNWNWARQGSGPGADRNWHVTASPLGGAVVCGQGISYPLTFGNLTTRSANAYLVQYDGLGNELAIDSIQPRTAGKMEMLDSDPNGNIYLGGNFRDANLTLGTHQVSFSTPPGMIDFYIAKWTGVQLSREAHSEFEVLMYPNPAQDCLTLTVPGSGLESLSYSLFDLSGRTHRKGRFRSGQECSVNLNGIPRGGYFLRVQEKNGKTWMGKVWVLRP